MPLTGRYSVINVHQVLVKSDLTESVNKFLPKYGEQRNFPVFYTSKNENILVLSHASDKFNSDNAGSIQKMLKKLVKCKEIEDCKNKTIIIPVIQEQKILGIIPRNHWVTLHYDPNTKCATLLDSRPWYVSMFYSTSAIKESLTAGIKEVYGVEAAKAMTFKTSYQGVQHNDTCCGAWTTKNIIALANGANIGEQKIAYKSSQEMVFVKANYKNVTGDSMPDPEKKTGFFQWLRSLFAKKPALNTVRFRNDDFVVIEEKKNESSDLEPCSPNSNAILHLINSPTLPVRTGDLELNKTEIPDQKEEDLEEKKRKLYLLNSNY